jgi:galactose mutarotase-like enzyme
MACVSLRHRGEQLLGDVSAFVPGRPPWTSGIPLLHPWANRLGGFGYGDVTLDPASPDLYIEEHGLPLHGLRSAVQGWEVRDQGPAHLVAGRAYDAPAFPFPHAIEVRAALTDLALTLTTTLTAGDRPVPVSFGYHPFLTLPGVPRAQWEIALPVAERLIVDDRLIPTGERVPAGDLDGPLRDRVFDDGFTLDAQGGPFVLEGGARRIEVAFEAGYRYAQIYAPAIADVVCFEPMTAPADALRHGPEPLAANRSFSARFSVSVAGR